MDKDEIEDEMRNFSFWLVPYGYACVEAVVRNALEAGFDGQWAAKEVTEFMIETGCSLEETDPIAIIYTSLLDNALADIEGLTGEELDVDISVYPNSICTCLNPSSEETLIVYHAMKKVGKENFTKAMWWLWNELDLNWVERNLEGSG